MVKHYDKQPLKELLKMSENLIRLTADDFDYQLICDELRKLSGAKFATISRFDANKEKAKTVAISGIREELARIAEITGLKMVGTKWTIVSGRVSQLKGGKLKQFDSLYEVSAGNIPKAIAVILEKTLNLGEVYAIEIADDKGKPLGEIVIVMGKTEELRQPDAVEIYASQVGLLLMRLKAENALLKEKQEKELILENLSEQVSYLDKDMRLVWANKYVCERHAISQEDYMGRRCYELFHGFSEPCLGCTVPEAIKKGMIVTGEVVSPDGHFWKLTSTPVYKEAEGLTGVLHFASDVTDLKASEAELKKLNLELEKRVEERTAELKNVIKELDAFTYSVSHDLRAPLRSIEGFSRVILEDYSDKFDPEGKKYFKRILAATDRMKHLIEDLLKLSRVTRHELNQSQVDLSRLAEIHVKEMREKEPHRNVQVIIEPDICVFGDQALLEIALVNLLDNAWKYTRDVEGATIKFGSQNSSESIVCYVQDQGVGFDQAYADKLFSPFKRLHSHEEYPGTGIGLSIVSRVIHRHGGEVWAEGEPGQGSAFYFKLPLKEKVERA